MFFILEITFFLVGLYLLVTGNVPQRVFGLLFGRKEYTTSPSSARLLGLLLTAPLPVGFCGGFILGFVFGEDAIAFVGIGEFIMLIAVAVIAIFMVRGMRVDPEAAALEAESENA